MGFLSSELCLVLNIAGPHREKTAWHSLCGCFAGQSCLDFETAAEIKYMINSKI